MVDKAQKALERIILEHHKGETLQNKSHKCRKIGKLIYPFNSISEAINSVRAKITRYESDIDELQDGDSEAEEENAEFTDLESWYNSTSTQLLKYYGSFNFGKGYDHMESYFTDVDCVIETEVTRREEKNSVVWNLLQIAVDHKQQLLSGFDCMYSILKGIAYKSKLEFGINLNEEDHIIYIADTFHFILRDPDYEYSALQTGMPLIEFPHEKHIFATNVMNEYRQRMNQLI